MKSKPQSKTAAKRGTSTKSKKSPARKSSAHASLVRRLFTRRSIAIGFIGLFAAAGVYVAFFALAATQVSSTAYCINGTMANGERTHDGAAAKNGVPFGTQYRVTSGSRAGKVVTIKDRSRPGATGLDIWMSSCSEARRYGRQSVGIEQINGGGSSGGGGASPSGDCHSQTLRRGARGDCVKHAQEHLNSKGASLRVDGDFGSGTQSAVRNFQRSNGLSADGAVGRRTWDALHDGGGGGNPQPAPVRSSYFGSDQLRTNQTMYRGQYLRSGNGRYIAEMQGDGNLVVYGPDRRVQWSSRTNGGDARLVMQDDGNLVIYNGSRAIWASRTNGRGSAFAIMQDDGNFVVYTNNGRRPIWASGR